MLAKPLFIAEKPDMGAKIAKNLPGPHKRGDGYIETGGGVVTWAIGHLLGQAPPEEYDPKYQKWVYTDLPILPTSWKLEVTSGKSKQVQVIKQLLKQCSDVVNAGDPGREGQLIVDELLEYLRNTKPVWRLLLNSLDAATVQKALGNMQPNTTFRPLYEAALGRQRADWIVGMNLTRAYTLLGRKAGYQSVLSVGRVQTPTLAIVVRREEEIEQFVPQRYWTLSCTIGSAPPFVAKYVAPAMYRADPPTPRPAWLDQHLRLCDESMVKTILGQVPDNTPATVVAYSNTPATEQPPLPFELSNIQSKMNAKHGASVQDVLDACQSLYEQGYASYPRTDCQYLPTNQFGEAGGVLAAVAKAMPALAGLVAKADTSLQSPAWNDSKLGEHHAIIPTGVAPAMESLSALERQVYEAISRSFLAQFFPACEVDKASVELEAGGHRWMARGRVIKVPGWREVYGNEEPEDEKVEGEAEEEEGGVLPALVVGEVHPLRGASAKDQQTKPPPRYSEGTLMQAMKHVDRLVQDPAEKKMLKAVQGIGRAATRSNIINTLIKRGFLETRKKQLHPSASARMLVNAVDKALVDPGLTARWEQALDGVAAGKIPLAAFEQRQHAWVTQLVQQAAGAVMPPPPAGAVTAAVPGSKTSGASKAGSSSGQHSGRSAGGAKKAGAKAGGAGKVTLCPKCNKPMAQRTVKQGPHAGKTFLGCTGYPQCNHSIWP